MPDRIKVHTEYGELSEISCYPQELNQLFINILMNALQAINEQGEIRIKTVEKVDYITVAISDNGVGIPEEIKNLIFEPFFTTRDVGQGAGLGLSVCYDIVMRHKGEILLESEQGRGSTFTIKLPVKQAEM